MAPKAEEKAKAKAKAGTAKVAVKKDGATKTTVTKTEAKKEEDVKSEEVKEEEMAEETAPEEPEKPEEVEEDAAEDKRKRVDPEDVSLNFAGATLNVLPTMNGKLLRSLSEGGFQYLLAGVKGTAGMKGGRYAFEARIVECLSPSEPQGTQGPAPRQLVRVGFSTAGSSVFLADTADCCCFDSEGFFVHGKKRSQVGQKFAFGETVAVLLNLDAGSPNANTVSLFKNGVRASEPQALPASLKGKTLFPTVAYKNVSLQVNFGPRPLVPLPFSCRMLKDAAAADVQVAKPPVPKDGKYEVIFPLGIPNEGTFEWVDQFLAKNPTFTELSERKIVEWAIKSGILRPKVTKGSKDCPEMNFGLPLLDDLSVRKVLSAVAPTMNRNFLVMELKNNLLPSQRKGSLAQFKDFKTTAMVAMGEPDAVYKAKVQQDMLTLKKKQAEEAKKKKAQEAERERLLKEKRRRAEEAKKARLAAQKKKEGTEEVGEEDKEEEAKAEEAENAEEKKEEEVEEPEEVELTEEEKKAWHKKQGVPDIGQATLNKCYAKFTLPEKAEGFDDVKYVWQKKDACTELLTSWIHDRKINQRVDDLEPGEWFKDVWGKWEKQVKEWKKRQQDWKNPVSKKAMLAKKTSEAKKQKAEAKEADGDEDEDGAEEADESPEIVADEIDVFAVEDVMDIGSGEPLFAEFAYEDWVLLALRFEFHLMLHSWKKDLNDPERPSFKENHVAYYYKKYFKKEFNVQSLGCEKIKDFMELIKEAVTINETTGYLDAEIEDDQPFHDFMKLTEEHRRDRQRRAEAGDEGAQLKFTKPAAALTAVPAKAGALASAQGVKRPIGGMLAGPAARATITPRGAYAPVAGMRPAYSPYGAAGYGAPTAGYGVPTRPGAYGMGMRPIGGSGYWMQ